MRFTIILPAYNAEKRIGVILKQLSEQLRKDCELIIIDDGSTDKTRDICIQYVEKYSQLSIRYFYKKNGGVSSARNYGLSKATGEFVLFVDADDEIGKNYLNHIFQITEFKADFYQLSYGHKYEGSDRTDKNVHSNMPEGYSTDLSTLHESYQYMVNNEVWNKIFSLKIIQEHGIKFPEDMKLGEDLVFCLEYSKHIKNWYVSKEVIYWYVRNFDAATVVYKREYISDLIKLYGILFEYYKVEKSILSRLTEYIIDSITQNYEAQEQFRDGWSLQLGKSRLYSQLIDSLCISGISNVIRKIELILVVKKRKYIFIFIRNIDRIMRKIKGIQ